MGKIRTSATGNRHEAGFTLIEMLVVLAIMAGLSAAFPLAWQRLSPQWQLQVYARLLVSDLRLLRAEAMRNNANADLTVAADAHAYRLAPDDVVKTLPEAIGLRLLPPTGVTMPATTVRFYPDGSSNGAEVLLERQGRQAKLVVSPMSGRVTQE